MTCLMIATQIPAGNCKCGSIVSSVFRNKSPRECVYNLSVCRIGELLLYRCLTGRAGARELKYD